MQDVVDEVWGNWLAKVDHRAAVIDWAVAILVAGGEGQATTLLAGGDREEDSELGMLFRRAVVEQGLVMPGGDEWDILERHWCRQIVSGKVEPRQGVLRLRGVWRRLTEGPWRPMMDPTEARLRRWVMLSESIVLLEDGYGGLEPFERLTPDTVEETIFNKARGVLLMERADKANGFERI